MANIWTNVSTPADLMAVANTNTGNIFWTVILYTIVIVLMLAMINFGVEVALMVSVFIGIILGILLVYMNLMNMTYLGILIGIELFMIIYLLITSAKNQ